MKNLFLTVFILLQFSSCSNKDEKPKDILSQDKMQEVLWDMMRADEFLNSYVVYRDTAIDKAAETQKWYEKVYQMHKITKKDFDRSYAYYNDHPALFTVMLDSIAKKAPPAAPGQALNDTTKKTDTVSLFNKNRLLDTLKKKRLLKKIVADQ